MLSKIKATTVLPIVLGCGLLSLSPVANAANIFVNVKVIDSPNCNDNKNTQGLANAIHNLVSGKLRDKGHEVATSVDSATERTELLLHVHRCFDRGPGIDVASIGLGIFTISNGTAPIVNADRVAFNYVSGLITYASNNNSDPKGLALDHLEKDLVNQINQNF